MERSLNQEVLNKVDVNALLFRFTTLEISLVFSVSMDYINKVARNQREIGYNFLNEENEMGFGRKNEFKKLKETSLYQQIMNK